MTRDFERGAWFAFDHVLGWINTLDDKAKLYKAVLEMRPATIQDGMRRTHT